MREIVREGMTLRKIQPSVCRLQWMGQQPTIESRDNLQRLSVGTNSILRQAGYPCGQNINAA
jgi:hypothetical protein